MSARGARGALGLSRSLALQCASAKARSPLCKAATAPRMPAEAADRAFRLAARTELFIQRPWLDLREAACVVDPRGVAAAVDHAHKRAATSKVAGSAVIQFAGVLLVNETAFATGRLVYGQSRRCVRYRLEVGIVDEGRAAQVIGIAGEDAARIGVQSDLVSLRRVEVRNRTQVARYCFDRARVRRRRCCL